jgi:hypothetical protein
MDYVHDGDAPMAGCFDVSELAPHPNAQQTQSLIDR